MAAVASRASNDSPRAISSRMSSPRDAKKNNTNKNEDRKDNGPDARVSPSRLETAEPVQPPELPASEADAKPSITTNGATSNTQPLGPPPRPSQQNQSDQADYFNTHHNNNSSSNNNNNSNSSNNNTTNNGGTYQAEPNPFEAQFGNPSTETPGKSLLPPVSSLTSPQPLLNAGTPGWPSLRSGPLSPAMLTGPTGAGDYFDTSFSRGFPTPNESGLRTGLTPGGGGSMFPAPSPNSQALFNSLQSGGGATPSTLDFYRTSLTSKAATQNSNFGGPTSQPTDPNLQQNMDRSQQQNQPDPYQQQQQQQQQHADADAVNGLYMLAQANSGMRNTNSNQFAVPGQAASVQTGMAPMQSATQSQETSPMAKRAAKNSIGGMSSMSADTADFSDSGQSEQAKPATRSRGKKATGKGAASNGKRKGEDTPSKTPANKRSKANNISAQNTANSLDGMDMSDDENSPQVDANGKKMTDEEKRKNFLERNRVAALKCRQRKKQWLANLQAKVELFSTENDALSQTVTQLREELVNLKTLLLAHKECPISQQQGLSGPAMNIYLGADAGTHHANPYGMGMQNGLPPGMQMPMGQGQQGQMQRR